MTPATLRQDRMMLATVGQDRMMLATAGQDCMTPATVRQDCMTPTTLMLGLGQGLLYTYYSRVGLWGWSWGRTL